MLDTVIIRGKVTMGDKLTDNYRAMLVFIVVIGSWLCGAITSFGVVAQFMDGSEPWVFIALIGCVLTFLFCLLIVRDRIYVELGRLVKGD